MWILHQPDGRAFDAEVRRQLEAAFETIFPGTPASPGATDANAAEFLDRLFAMDDSTFYDIPRWRDLYAKALPALAAAARSLHGASLADLPPEQRADVLGRLARGELEGMPADVDQKAFFALLRGHCIEGCFADPRWGGNAHGAIWRWYGYLQPARPFKREQATEQVQAAAESPTTGSSLTRFGG
jgi:gluconate 2-dehydrogenase gamma chain